MSDERDEPPDLELAFGVWLEEFERGGAPETDAFLDSHPELLRTALRQRIEEFLSFRSLIQGAPEQLQAGRRIGEYRLIERLGTGGAATVWEAVRGGHATRVALKVLHPHLALIPRVVDRFRREAAAAERLSHPFIVQLHDAGQAEGNCYIACELVAPARTLLDGVPDAVSTPDAERFAWIVERFIEACDALAHAHLRGVIHRDVKPTNILLTPDDHIKLADFGLASVTEEVALTATGETCGTPYYMSPEQLAPHHLGLDRRTDIFSLGATLYEALTGRARLRRTERPGRTDDGRDRASHASTPARSPRATFAERYLHAGAREGAAQSVRVGERVGCGPAALPSGSRARGSGSCHPRARCVPGPAVGPFEVGCAPPHWSWLASCASCS